MKLPDLVLVKGNFPILKPMDNYLSLCGLLKAVAATCERELNEALADLGISHCQASILAQISKSGPVTMSAVSKELCCHKSNVTQVVDGLVAKDLLERVASKEDRRMSTLVLTRKGKVVAAKSLTILTKAARECMGLFSTTERQSLKKLLEKSLKKHRAA